MAPKLLIDSLPFKVSMEEAKGQPGRVVARGEYARFDKKTENNRHYPKKLWEKNFKRLHESMERRRLFGELDHPGDGKTKLQRVSHLTTELNINEDGTVVGASEVLDTPNGRILKALFGAGCEVGVSSRGFGSTVVKEDGTEEVGEDYVLLGFDFVADPATKTAYPAIYAEEKNIPENDMDLTKEVLAKQYPGLLKEIEEQVRQDTKAKLETEGKDAAQQAITEAVSDAEKRVETSMKEKFSTELVSKLEQIRVEAEEKVRGEMLSDPKVAGSKTIVDQIAALVAPVSVPADAQAIIKTKDEEISTLKKSLAEKDLELAKNRKELEELSAVAKKAAYTLYLERRLTGMEAETANAVRSLVGDVTSFAGTKEIDAKVQAVVEELKRQSHDQKTVAEDTKKKDDEIKELRDENAKLRGALTKVEELTDKMKLQTYIEARLAGNPKADHLRKVLAKVTTQEEVDELLKEETKDNKDPDEMSRIRARIARGKQRDIHEDTTGKAKDGVSQPGDPTLFGVPVNDLARLSGIGQ